MEGAGLELTQMVDGAHSERPGTGAVSRPTRVGSPVSRMREPLSGQATVGSRWTLIGRISRSNVLHVQQSGIWGP
jgi:hypothetical protein